MPNVANFRMEGMDQLLKKLNTLGPKVYKKGAKNAVNKAARPILKTAKSLAPKGESGLLRIALGLKTKLYKKTLTAIAILGPRTEFKSKRKAGKFAKYKPSNYAHLVEYGTKSHYLKYIKLGKLIISRKWRHPGTKAKPFLRPAFDLNKQKYQAICAHEIMGTINSEAIL